jgi:hypothetical protein
MTNVEKSNAREMGFQLQRDFKFHLAHEIDLTRLTKFIETGNSPAVDHELAQLAILYSDKIKEQAGSSHC